MEARFGEYVISDDKSRLQIDTICRFLAASYWANRRTREAIERSIANSVCFGVYHGNRQIGFARIVTDGATMYWLCDVFVDESYRGKGIGKKLVGTIVEAGPYRRLSGFLGTLDAHGLYEAYGFARDPERFMVRRPARPPG